MKKISPIFSLLMTTCLSLPAHAGIDFTKFEHTLDKLRADGQSPIASRYDLTFTKLTNPQSESDYKFAVYNLNSQGKPTAEYYTYEIPSSFKDGTKLSSAYNFTTDSPYSGDISGYFYNNSGKRGGAISNNRNDMGSIYGEFINNIATEHGASVFNSGSIKNIYGDFINNFASTYGAGITTLVSVDTIAGNFIMNRASAGVAIYNQGMVKLITGNFIQNSSTGGSGGVIFNNTDSHIVRMEGNYIGNHATSAGVVWNYGGVIDHISGLFIANTTAEKGGGGVLMNMDKSGTNTSVGEITGTFIGNYASSGGAIANSANIDKIYNAYFYDNHTSRDDDLSRGGAFDNYGTLGKIINSSFINNYAEGLKETLAFGGAIYSSTNLWIEADNGLSEFSGNYIISNGNKESNAIYMNKNGDAGLLPELTFNAVNQGTIIINDDINGKNGYKLILEGDTTSTININAAIKNAEIISGNISENIQTNATEGVTTNIAAASMLNHNNSLTVNKGVINILDIDTDQINLKETNLNGGLLNIERLGLSNLKFDTLAFNGGALSVGELGVDLASQTSGSISADTTSGKAKIIVHSVDVTSDAAGTNTSVTFAKDNILSQQIINNVVSAQGPVFNYGVSYNPETGEFIFTRPEHPGKGDLNPEVERSSISAAAAVSVLSDEIYSRVLANADSAPKTTGYSRALSNAWIKTFASDDAVDLKNFNGADTRFDGLIAGFGSGRISEGRGISATYNAYAAYANGESKFAGQKILQNAYYLGVGANFYKGNAFLGTTANVAMIRNRADAHSGKDKFSSYVGGAAAKLGYNFEIAGMTIQPNLYASYTYVNANDYITRRGAKVEMNGLSNFELAPGLKLAKQFGDGLNGYLKARYVHNFNESQKIYANDFRLPEISLKAYTEYGFGVEKNAENYSGFAELTRRDGGREGWNGIIGFKHNF